MSRSISKIVAATLMIVFVFVLFPGKKLNAAEKLSGTCGDNVKWVLDTDGTLTISGTGATKNYVACPFGETDDIKNVVIESGVTSIGDCLLYECTNLISVTIPDSVVRIGSYAFGSCYNLSNITIPNSVTYIGGGALSHCERLTNITLPDSITEINTHLFMGCKSLSSITIPNSVTSIELSAFGNCYHLSNITIPNSVTSIGDFTFEYCSSLTNITIPNSVTSIGNEAFGGCDKLTSITIKKSLYEQCNNAFPNISSDKFNFLYYYNLRYTTDGNGSVMGPSETLDSSAETLTMSPNKGFTVDKVTWSDGIGDPVELKAVNDKYTMPKPSDSFNYGADTVTIKVFFKKVEYEITFKNYDGTVLEKKNVPYGNVPSYTGTITPSKPSSGGYSYTFAGWDTALVAVTGPATYTATYTWKEIEYKVTFVDYDGVEICSDTVKYHEVPVFNGNTTPVRKETDTHTFTFVGWSDGKTTYSLDQGLPQIESDTTFSPVFDPVVKPVYTVGEVKGDGINSDIVIDVHRNVDDENCLTYFLGATIDGTEIKANDQYTATKGSTIITIKKDFLSTLPAGEHEVQVVFNDGSISTKVTIAAKASVPSTGEVTGPAAYIGLTLIAAASVCGAGVVLLKKRKEA